MKVFKVVPYIDVEHLSLDGWELVQVIHATRRETISLRTPVAVEGCAPTYSGGCPSPGHVDTATRNEVVMVNEPLFLMSQDREIIGREKVLEARVAELVAQTKMQDARMKDVETQLAQEARDNAAHEKSSNEWMHKYFDETKLRQKLEGDLAKVRTSIGTAAYNDAVK